MRREELEGPADRTRSGRSNGRPRMPARSCSSWPATRRWSSSSRSASSGASGSAPRRRHARRAEPRRRRRRGPRSRVVERFVELEAELRQGRRGAARRPGRGRSTADPALARSTGSKLETALAAVQGTPTASRPPSAAAAEPVEADEPEAGRRARGGDRGRCEPADAPRPSRGDGRRRRDRRGRPGAAPRRVADDRGLARRAVSRDAPDREPPPPDPVAEIEAAIARDEGTPDDEDPLDDPDVDDDILDADLDPAEDPDAAEAEVIAEAAAAADDPRPRSRRRPTRARRRQDRRASPPTTTSPRPAARSCASTSPGCSPARPGTRIGHDLEELHAMRVATRRQRAAWRVFGDVVPARADAALPQRPARDRRAARRRPRPRRPARGGRPLPRGPAGHRAAGARAAPVRLARPPRRRAACCSSASSTRTATGAGSTTTATSSGPRAPRSCRSGRSSRTASATRRASRIWTAYEQVRALRARPALGRRRDAPRAADRRQVAALHARVRPRGARPTMRRR